MVKRLGEEIPELRIDADFRNTTVQSKVKEAEIMRVPYIIVVGDKEEKEKTLAVRIRGDSKIVSLKTDDFIRKIKEEIKNRKS